MLPNTENHFPDYFPLHNQTLEFYFLYGNSLSPTFILHSEFDLRWTKCTLSDNCRWEREKTDERGERKVRIKKILKTFTIFIRTIPNIRLYCSKYQNFLTFDTPHDDLFLVCQMPNIWHLTHLIRMLLLPIDSINFLWKNTSESAEFKQLRGYIMP